MCLHLNCSRFLRVIILDSAVSWLNVTHGFLFYCSMCCRWAKWVCHQCFTMFFLLLSAKCINAWVLYSTWLFVRMLFVNVSQWKWLSFPFSDNLGFAFPTRWSSALSQLNKLHTIRLFRAFINNYLAYSFFLMWNFSMFFCAYFSLFISSSDTGVVCSTNTGLYFNNFMTSISSFANKAIYTMAAHFYHSSEGFGEARSQKGSMSSGSLEYGNC